MQIKPEHLAEMGYAHFETLPHKDLANFLQPYLFKKNGFVIFYYVATFLPLSIWFFWLGMELAKENVKSEMLHFFSGIALVFLLIPLHELLHGVAYWWVGAKKITYGADWKKLVFYALADQYVLDEKEFRLVALMPFVVITTLGIGLFFVLPIQWGYGVMGIIFFHSLFCGGDFGLLSYFVTHKNHQIVTYDDVKNQVSYFYAKSLEDLKPNP